MEVDEYQHESYGVACDVSRMVKLVEAWLLEGNTLPVRFIRYNPHAYKVDGKTSRVPKKVREARLLEAIREAAEADGEGMQIRYMYYDVESGQPVRSCKTRPSQSLIAVWSPSSEETLRLGSLGDTNSAHQWTQVFNVSRHFRRHRRRIRRTLLIEQPQSLQRGLGAGQVCQVIPGRPLSTAG